MSADHNLLDFVVRTAMAGDDPGTLLAAVLDRLAQEGLPLWRASLGMRTIDPMIRAFSLIWQRGQGVVEETAEHGAAGDAEFARSPIHHLQSLGLLEGRWRIEEGEGCDGLPLLGTLRARGGTDYALRLVPFAGGGTVTGAAFSIATDRPGGFAAEDLARFDRLLPALGLAVHRSSLARIVRETLGIYLGPRTASRVLAGEIRRGEGQTLPAAILMADLRGFTALGERASAPAVVRWLDEHFEVIGEAVAEAGGEILKFMGDGLLAIFPADPSGPLPCRACEGALDAAREAIRRTDALNRRRGDPALALDVALTFGEVVYGNVGAARRLDFTVIGGAVNQASRLEALTGALSQPLLLSGPFASRISQPTERLGSFPMKGLEELQEVWILAGDSTQA